PSLVAPRCHLCSATPRDRPPFPTRRSSDLTVAGILGLPPGDRPPSARQLRSAIRAARQLASDVEDRGAEHRGRFAWRVLTANPRLILRTVHAHQPWLLAASLSRSMSAGLATGALTLITTDL